MAVVAVVSGTTKAEHVVLEAAHLAEAEGTAVHVVYLVGLGWLAALEVGLSERLGVPTRTGAIRDVCARKAERIADPLLDDYVAVGLVGRPVDELVQYCEAVDVDHVVMDRNVNWGAGLESILRDPATALRERNVPVVPVG